MEGREEPRLGTVRRFGELRVNPVRPGGQVLEHSDLGRRAPEQIRVGASHHTAAHHPHEGILLARLGEDPTAQKVQEVVDPQVGGHVRVRDRTRGIHLRHALAIGLAVGDLVADPAPRER